MQEEPQDTPANRRRTFTREFKLGVIKYHKNVKSIHRTSDKYKIDRKQVRSQKRKEGRIIKKLWFVSRAKQIFRSKYNDTGTEFKFSNNWFIEFRKRHRISFRKKIMLLREVLRELIENFHKTSQSVRRRGTYQLSDLSQYGPDAASLRHGRW